MKTKPENSINPYGVAYVLKSVAELVANPKNARTHSKAQIKKLARSIEEFQFLNPCIIDADGMLIAGHGRVQAAKSLGLEKVPCIIADHLTDAQKAAYTIADNRLAEDAGWDQDLLRVELQSLRDLDFDLSLTGLEDIELDELFEDEKPGLTDDDDVPAVPVEPVSMLGDIWILGDHRLMCGDSTSLKDAEKLMAGSLADLVFTDPPYNVAYSGRGDNNLGTIQNDDMTDAQFEAFLAAVFDTCKAVMRPLACIYVCHPDSQSAPKLAFEKTFGERFKKSSTIIWAKQSAGMGWQDYRAQHEPILYGWKDGKGKHFFCGDRSKTTVWDIGRDSQISYVHPTQKPVALPIEAIENSSLGKNIVLDLFGGSGSTLIACEKTNRHARLMELDPKYVDVIVKRWEEFSGKKAKLESDGKTYEQTKKDRRKEV